MNIPKYLTIILCAVFVLFFSFWCFFVATPDYSFSERRALATMPEITWESIKTGEFAKEFEEYTTDRFPLRDAWRSIKAYARLGLFMQKENNDIFVKDGHIGKIEYPINYEMLDYSISLFNKVKDKYFQDNRVYFSVIPDKNKYISDLKLDYDALEEYIKNGLQFASYISVDHLLSADDYYFTDSHWKQEKIVDVAKHLAQTMGTDVPDDYETYTLNTEFNGVYSGQSALNFKPDKIRYLSNDIIENLRVTGANAVYDMGRADSKDPYEFFLSGNQPLVKIENPNSQSGKKLLVFRDSFASSLMPILAQGYNEVTMVDLRYMNSELLNQFVDFSDSDVLFLYSASLLNNSTSMK